MKKNLFLTFSLFLCSCSSDLSPVQEVGDARNESYVFNSIHYQSFLKGADESFDSEKYITFENNQPRTKSRKSMNQHNGAITSADNSYFFNFSSVGEDKKTEDSTAIQLLNRDIANINRNLGWFLTVALSFLAIAIGLASLIGILTFRQNNKLTKLHDDYENKLRELNHKSLEFVDKSNEIALLERKNEIMLEVFLTNSTVTRAYMLIPKLEGVIQRIRKEKSNSDLTAYANDMLDEMNLYAESAYEKLHGLRREVKVNYSQEEDIFFELIDLSSRVRLFIGLCAKRRFELNRNRSLLIEAEAELKRCIDEDFPFLKNDSDKARVYYNLACYLSLLNKFEESLKFLKLSWKLNSRYFEASKKDDDLKSLIEAKPKEFSGSDTGELL
tara:strand:+ start:23 stop:1180 length:1158 start_codon:yes stop_codon:yes gene_type:complete